MSGQNPAMVVRVAGNIDELRKNLAEGKGLIETTTAAMGKMSASLDGSKLEQRAMNVVAAIDAIGGAVKLTDAEARRHLTTLDAWIEKADRLGKDVPGGIDKMRDSLAGVLERSDRISKNMPEGFRAAGAAIGATRSKSDELHASFQKVDSMLASMGINIGTDVKGLGELVGASGQTAAGLGAVATAGLVTTAALAGWKAGRMVAEFFDLDKLIGDATAKLLGFGDVAAQESAAKADVLAKASKLAGVQITDLSLAMVINEAAAKSHAEQLNTSENRVAGWRAEIAKVQADGNFAKLTADLKSQNFDVKELADRYHLSVDAIQFYAKEAKKADDAVIASNKRKIDATQQALDLAKQAFAIETKAREEAAKNWEEYDDLRVSHGGTATEIQIAQTKRWQASQIAATKNAESQLVDLYRQTGMSAEEAATKAAAAFKSSFDSIAAEGRERLRDTRLDWDQYEQYSKQHLQDVADRAQALYEEMLANAGKFSRGAIQYQRAIAEAARDDAKAWADPWEKNIDHIEDKLDHVREKQAQPPPAQGSGSRGSSGSSSSSTPEGPLTPLQNLDLLLNSKRGSSETYDLSTPEGMAYFKKMNPAAAVLASMEYFATHTIQQAVQAGLIDFYAGYKRGGLGGMVGFADGVTNATGGLAIVGERGPELMYVPPHANIYPTGTGPAGAGVTIHQTYYVNGTGFDIYRFIRDAMVRELKSTRMLGAA